MGGKMSRNKGLRGEYCLRDFLRKAGWTANRVPSSGAAQGFKGDVKAEKDGHVVLFEMKFRKDAFKMIYALYEEHRRLIQDDVLSFASGGGHLLQCVSLSSSLDAVFDGPDFYVVMENHALYRKYKRTFAKIAGLQKLLGEATVLVLKDNNRPLLFVRFR